MSFWTDHSPRERMLLFVAAVLFGPIAIYYLIFAPIAGWRADMAADKRQAISTYEIVREAASIGDGGNNTAVQNTNTPIRNSLIQSARSNAIALNFVNLRPDGNVEASADAVDPETLFNWLNELANANGIYAISADIGRERGNAELVRAQFVFARQ